MQWAAVPKATVNKHCYTLPSKREVGLAKQRSVTSPTGDTLPSENPH